MCFGGEALNFPGGSSLSFKVNFIRYMCNCVTPPVPSGACSLELKGVWPCTIDSQRHILEKAGRELIKLP